LVRSNTTVAGTAILVGAIQFGLALVLSEVYYSQYDVSTNYISDLGATCNNVCVIHEPSSIIFNSSIILLGVLIVIGAVFLYRAFHVPSFSVMVALAGVGAMGVGSFPETTGVYHAVFSLVVFLFTGLSAIVAFGVVKSPLSYISALLGLVTLASLVLYVGQIYLGLGPGGMERMVVYPTLLWAVGFGGYLIGADDWSKHGVTSARVTR
jgi:hypothetical membrane protein